MATPWDISADTIDQWAQRSGAEYVFPKLVARLLLATAPAETMVEMRADGGTRLGGWDGMVTARQGRGFCPHGFSGWELSVTKKGKAKLNEDFDKRAETPPSSVAPARTTYVAVMARRFTQKADWAQEKKKLDIWADVRLYDADDLAAWLMQAPAVAHWFAAELGSPVDGLRDVESFLEAWRQRTQPPLPFELAVTGKAREEAAEGVRAWLAGQGPSSLHIWGEKQEDALIFAAAAMALAPAPERERWLARALVVESPEAWRWATAPVQNTEPLILLPAFEGADPERAEGRARVVVPHVGRPRDTAAGIALEHVPFGLVAEVLHRVGFSEQDASRLAQGSGGSLPALQRLCGYTEPPAWASGSARAPWIAMLLAGAWAPQNSADREALRRLGADPEEVESVCVESSREADAPIRHDQERWQQGAYRWVSRADAWNELAPRLTHADLERFAEVVERVLGEHDPRYDAPKEERIFAAIQGKILAHSAALREGLADSLARLSLSDDVLRPALGPGRGSMLARKLVHRLLQPEWHAWASLSDVLPVLAEAAPDVFLEALEESLKQDDGGAAHLLAEEGEFGSPHTGLLWALETLGWSPQLLPRVALALARLAARDPGGRLANRSENSLFVLLHPVMPQTNTTLEERLGVFSRIRDREPDVGWRLAIAMIHGMQGGMSPSPRPKYRSWYLPSQDRRVPRQETYTQIERIIDSSVRAAGEDAGRWAELVDAADFLPPELELHVLKPLEERCGSIPDPGQRLWSTLRERLHRAYMRHTDERADVARGNVALLERVYNLFAPTDLVARTAWLFAPFVMMPEKMSAEHYSDDEEEARKRARRQQAVEKIWQDDDRWPTLAALARAVELPGGLGTTLADATFSGDIESALMRSTPEPDLASLVPGFIARTFFHKGKPWLEETVKSLLQQGRTQEAVASVTGVWPGRELWDVLDAIGEPLRGEYWRKVEAISGEHAAEDWEHAIDNLLVAERPSAALQAASWSRGAISPATALRVLEALHAAMQAGTADTPVKGRLVAYDIEQLFGLLDRDPTIDTSRLIALELYFLPWLERSERSARRLFAAMQESPALFVELVSMSYRSEGEREPEAAPDDAAAELQRRRALGALNVLDSWRGYPGQDLPETQQREERLLAWAQEALEQTREAERAGGGSSELAKVLARVPHGPDGLWPCRAARELIERDQVERFAHKLAIAKRNLRGMTSRALAAGGKQERELAATYRKSAERLRTDWPRTAAMLDELAAEYAHEAAEEDEEARTIRARHGLDREQEREASAQPPAPAGPATPEDIAAVDWIDLRDLELSPSLRVDLAPRLSLFTGNNGAGKTLVLDALFWSLTGLWPGMKAWPAREARRKGSAAIAIGWGEDGEAVSRFDPKQEEWIRPAGWPTTRAVVLYAHLNGRFSLWDPVRNRGNGNGSKEQVSGYLFSATQVWDGMPGVGGKMLCNGLLADLGDWQFRRRRLFDLMSAVLARLSPDDMPLKLGEPARISIGDTRDIPTLEMPYGAVPVVHASAAIKRILGLAYLLVWTWHEHQESARLAGEDVVPRLVLLIDEVEAHLHPTWQRMLLPALFEAVNGLSRELDLQVVASTHAPLITASVESLFDEELDKLFRFEIEGNRAVVDELPWAKQGDVVNWLVSETFGLRQARSRDAERAIEAAEAFMRGAPTPPDLDTREKIHTALKHTLPGHDDFWPRWLVETGAVR